MQYWQRIWETLQHQHQQSNTKRWKFVKNENWSLRRKGGRWWTAARTRWDCPSETWAADRRRSEWEPRRSASAGSLRVRRKKATQHETHGWWGGQGNRAYQSSSCGRSRGPSRLGNRGQTLRTRSVQQAARKIRKRKDAGQQKTSLECLRIEVRSSEDAIEDVVDFQVAADGLQLALVGRILVGRRHALVYKTTSGEHVDARISRAEGRKKKENLPGVRPSSFLFASRAFISATKIGKSWKKPRKKGMKPTKLHQNCVINKRGDRSMRNQNLFVQNGKKSTKKEENRIAWGSTTFSTFFSSAGAAILVFLEL